jgi:hypothetical protein
VNMRTVGRRTARLVLGGALAGAVLMASAGPAAARKSGGRAPKGSTTSGFDVSFPQCGTALPATTEFGVVGVNGGIANDLNPCFGPSSSYPSYRETELYWAATASVGGSGQPDVSLYVNTGDPGNLYQGHAIADWPTSSSPADPYGSCTTTTATVTGGTAVVGADSDACAWQYGWNKASQDTQWLVAATGAIDGQEATTAISASPAGYPWWLDVETANSWQPDTTMNVADLQGMVAALQAAGATTIGVYSTSAQWSTITGASEAGSLSGMAEWVPGASTRSGAKANCTVSSFTGGRITLTQWSAAIDHDLAC